MRALHLPPWPALSAATLLCAALLGPAASGAAVATDPAPAGGEDPYRDLVAPILAAKCVHCHGPERQRAGLRLDGHARLAAGSEYGPVLVPGRPEASALLQVLQLPAEHERHMPPDGKAQLAPEELELLTWWVRAGAPDEGAGNLDGLAAPLRDWLRAEGRLGSTPPSAVATGLDYATRIEPLLRGFCFECHGGAEPAGDIPLADLDPDLVNGGDAEGWHAALDMLNGGTMPPPRAPQPSGDERRAMVAWITENLRLAAMARQGEARTVLRRLTKSQYTNSLRDLLGLQIDFGRVLPDDAKSRMGFSNNGEVLQASALHLEYYQEIARHALEQAIVVGDRPPVTRYRVTFGRGLGRGEIAGTTGGYQSVPLATEDFRLEVLERDGRVREPGTEDERKAAEELRKRISIGLRGSSQSRFRLMEDGMILYGARPHVERVPAAWQGPSPNLKLEMQRCFPEHGDFELRVVASRGYLLPSDKLTLIELEERVPVTTLDPETGLAVPRPGAFLLDAAAGDERQNMDAVGGLLTPTILTEPSSVRLFLELQEPGYYQFDLVHPEARADAMPSVRLSLDGQQLDHRLVVDAPRSGEAATADPSESFVTALGAAYLPAGRRTLKLGGAFFVGFRQLVASPLPLDHPSVVPLTAATEELAARIATKTPSLRAYVGTRTDDGMDYKTFGERHTVEAPLGEPETYVFAGRLENLPIPEPESGDTEILSGFMLLGLWNDYLVKDSGDPGPPVLIRSMEFEAPLFASWPPPSHERIFASSAHLLDPRARTRALLGDFLGRAFRRPATSAEVQRYLDAWSELRPEFATYEESIREVLVAALCSPHFLFLVEPEADDGLASLPAAALASRLSYFLWNSPPDDELLDLAAAGRLRDELAAQVERMIDDPRSERFVRPFVHEWLRLDRHDGMTVNADAHPGYTRFVKEDLREETMLFFREVLRSGRSLFALLDPGFAMLNQNLAEYYGIPDVEGMQFRPVPLPAGSERGGLLTQGAFLAGHSDGTQAHPIKRAVWVREKLLGDPPPPPPPNVPNLDPEAPGFEGLSLKEQLERHRDNPSCHDCHAGIDPFGLVFENYDASGLFHKERGGAIIDTSSTLPDGTEVVGVADMKAYLLNQKAEAFAASLTKHLFAYALGRDVHFSDAVELESIRAFARERGDRLRAVLQGIVLSPAFQNP